MKSIDTFIEYVGRFTALILIVLSLLVVYDALSRYLFHSGSIALQELEWHLFDFVILLGIPYALKEGAHVRVDIFYASFSAKTKAMVNLFSQVFLILPFASLVIYMGYDFVLQSFVQLEGSSDPGGLPYRFIVKSLMLLSFSLLILQSLSESIKSWKLIKS
ncbi:MAG: C4-dicarboxylate ABC transporter [Arcobacter sp.]|nr:MAG: C4-dicarboxylate ABC transporter [Arcobacter sp.]